jgi:hypothetical protein
MKPIGILVLSAALLACEPATESGSLAAEGTETGAESALDDRSGLEETEGTPGEEPGAEEPDLEDPIEDPAIEEPVVEEPVAEPTPPEGEGYTVGQIAENWTLRNQEGDEVSLHDYYGKVIFFEDGSQW